MDQREFTSRFCAKPQNFAWFLGAGTSSTAGLPTATDVLWDMKRLYYCREENQEISHQDLQNESVRTKIQRYMESRGFPAMWADDEYPVYFHKIFGNDKERQRQYLKGILSEEKVTLSVGNRVIGALIGVGFCRAAFTTNFDTVVEKAVAVVAGKSLSAFHLEGSHAANQALNNEEFPIYCKLHGDFRYDSLKNLTADLATQNAALAECLVNAGNRFGFVVSGYSGRDQSVMDLFRSVLNTSNPFPHGFFWTGIKSSTPSPAVDELLRQARAKGVEAHFVPIETFDALLLRLWRNISSKPDSIDAQVRKVTSTTVNIPLFPEGRVQPLLRLNALPVHSTPKRCLELVFKNWKNWEDINKARARSEGKLILTRGKTVWCWGNRDLIEKAFGDRPESVTERDLPTDLSLESNLYVKGFVEEALCRALARGKALRPVISRHSACLVADGGVGKQSDLQRLTSIVGAHSGVVQGIMAPITEDQPIAERVTWAEAVRISLDSKNGQLWLLLEPDVWIEPTRARKVAIKFLDVRRGDRYNKKFNELLDAWVQIVLGTAERNTEVTVSLLDGDTAAENPSFRISSRTAFARRASE